MRPYPSSADGDPRLHDECYGASPAIGGCACAAADTKDFPTAYDDTEGHSIRTESTWLRGIPTRFLLQMAEARCTSVPARLLTSGPTPGSATQTCPAASPCCRWYLGRLTDCAMFAADRRLAADSGDHRFADLAPAKPENQHGPGLTRSARGIVRLLIWRSRRGGRGEAMATCCRSLQHTDDEVLLGSAGEHVRSELLGAASGLDARRRDATGRRGRRRLDAASRSAVRTASPDSPADSTRPGSSRLPVPPG